MNTGHATVAYTGFLQGAKTISEAIAIPLVREAAEDALRETSAALVAKHGLDEDEMAAYRAKILDRFTNPHLVDEVTRVGREPLRKLGRNDRFIGPAIDHVAYVGSVPQALLAAVGAALRFDVPEDTQSVELRRLLEEATPEDIVTEITGSCRARPSTSRSSRSCARCRAELGSSAQRGCSVVVGSKHHASIDGHSP